MESTLLSADSLTAGCIESPASAAANSLALSLPSFAGDLAARLANGVGWPPALARRRETQRAPGQRWWVAAGRRPAPSCASGPSETQRATARCSASTARPSLAPGGRGRRRRAAAAAPLECCPSCCPLVGSVCNPPGSGGHRASFYLETQGSCCATEPTSATLLTKHTFSRQQISASINATNQKQYMH